MSRDGSESDLKAQPLELAHEALLFLVPIEFIEVGSAEFLVVLRVRQHVIHNDQEGVDSCAALVDELPLSSTSRATADCRPHYVAPVWD